MTIGKGFSHYRGVEKLARQKQQVGHTGRPRSLVKEQRRADRDAVERVVEERGLSVGGRQELSQEYDPPPPCTLPLPCLSLPASFTPCCPGDASLYPEPCGAGQTFAQGGVWGSLLLPGSEPEQHCLFPPGHSVEGAAERWTTGEFPCREGCPEVVRWSEKGGRQENIAGDRTGLRTEAM